MPKHNNRSIPSIMVNGNDAGITTGMTTAMAVPGELPESMVIAGRFAADINQVVKPYCG